LKTPVRRPTITEYQLFFLRPTPATIRVGVAGGYCEVADDELWPVMGVVDVVIEDSVDNSELGWMLQCWVDLVVCEFAEFDGFKALTGLNVAVGEIVTESSVI